MESIYTFIDTILPFTWLEHDFMKNAFLAILIATPLFGILGTMVVNNKMAFFSDSIGHSALTGIALGIVFGVKDPALGMILFSVFFAIGMLYIKNKSKVSPDTIIGVFSSTAIAIGIVLLSKGGGFNKYTSYLIGNILSISIEEIFFLLLVAVVVIFVWLILFNRLLLVSISPSLAKSRGSRVVVIEGIFTIILSVVVATAIQWIGLLMINSMLVLPAAAARNISLNVRSYHFYSVFFAVISGVLGLIISYYLKTSTGATIVLVLAIIYLSTLFLKGKFE